jgi:hypothetical protein
VARGWESKSIEDQIAEREAEAQKANAPQLTPTQLEHRAKREGLMLARCRTVASLETARDARYRAMLERALAHLDSQLAELDAEESGSREL